MMETADFMVKLAYRMSEKFYGNKALDYNLDLDLRYVAVHCGKGL